MNRDDRQLTDRLRSAYEIEMTDETRDRQLSAISVALMEPPVAAPVAVPITARWRHRLAALVVATTVVTPAAVAVAAESSLPGELLYPVKQVTEDVRSVVDSTVVARHRLDEAGMMLERGFPVEEVDGALVEADIAITDAGDHPDLRSRWTEMRDHMVTDVADDTSGVPHDSVTPPRGDSDEMRDGTGGPMTDEMMPGDGTNHDRSGGTHDGADSEMDPGTGTHEDRDTDGTSDMAPGSDMGTGDSGSVDDAGGTMTDEGSADTSGGTPTEDSGDTWTDGSGSDQGSGMDGDTGDWTGSGHDGNG